MNTVYSNDKYREAKRIEEEAQYQQLLAAKEYLAQRIENSVKNILEEIKEEREPRHREMVLKLMLKELVQDAIQTREATNSGNMNLIVEIEL